MAQGLRVLKQKTQVPPLVGELRSRVWCGVINKERMSTTFIKKKFAPPISQALFRNNTDDPSDRLEWLPKK